MDFYFNVSGKVVFGFTVYYLTFHQRSKDDFNYSSKYKDGIKGFWVINDEDKYGKKMF